MSSSAARANPTSTGLILTLNGGSSSIKFALFKIGKTLPRVMEGRIERIGLTDATFTVKGSEDSSRQVSAPNLSDVMRWRFAPSRSTT